MGDFLCPKRRKEYAKEWRAANVEKRRRDMSAWRDKNREYLRETNKRTRVLVRTRILMLYGAACARCQFTDERALQLDHIHGCNDAQGATTRSSTGLYNAILDGTLKVSDFQLLCANCNWIKRHEADECSYERKQRRKALRVAHKAAA